MKERLQRFMIGRYGNDQLNQFIYETVSVLYIDIDFIDYRICENIVPEYQ